MPLSLPAGSVEINCPTCGNVNRFRKDMLSEGWNIKTCEFENGGCALPFAIMINIDIFIIAYIIKTPGYDSREEIFGDAKKPENCPECGSNKICRVDDVSRGDFKYDCLSCGLFFGDRVDMTQPLKPETDDAIEEIRDLEKLREENDPDVN